MQQPSPCIPAQPLCLEGHLHHLPFHCFNAILIPQEQKSSDIWSAKEPFFPYLLEQPQALSSVSQYEERETFTKHYPSKQTKKKGALHFADQNQDKSTEIYYRPIVCPYPDPSSAAAANKNEASKQLTIAHIQQKTIPQACVEQCTIRGFKPHVWGDQYLQCNQKLEQYSVSRLPGNYSEEIIPRSFVMIQTEAELCTAVPKALGTHWCVRRSWDPSPGLCLQSCPWAASCSPCCPYRPSVGRRHWQKGQRKQPQRVVGLAQSLSWQIKTKSNRKN